MEYCRKTYKYAQDKNTGIYVFMLKAAEAEKLIREEDTMNAEDIYESIDSLTGELDAEIGHMGILYGSYLDEMKSECTSMHECIQLGNYDMLQRTIHNIKGVSANLGVTEVFEYASKFDELLKQNRTSGAREHVKNLAGIIDNASAIIRKYFLDRDINI